MIAEDIMTQNVITIGVDCTVEEAIDLLLEKGINQLPVKGEDGNLTGIITVRSILSLILPGYIMEGHLKDVAFAPDLPRLCKNFEELSRKKVGDVMEKGIKIKPKTSALEVATILMNPNKNVDVLIVIDEYNKPIGIITREDIIRCLKRRC